MLRVSKPNIFDRFVVLVFFVTLLLLWHISLHLHLIHLVR